MKLNIETVALAQTRQRAEQANVKVKATFILLKSVLSPKSESKAEKIVQMLLRLD